MITLIPKQYYTRVWTKGPFKGQKCIFRYKGKSDNQDMIEVSMYCSNMQEEFSEDDTEITISKEGTGEFSEVIEASEEDIEFLNFVKDNWKHIENDNGYLNLSEGQKRFLYNAYKEDVEMSAKKILINDNDRAIADLNHHTINAAMSIMALAPDNKEIQEQCDRIVNAVRSFTKEQNKKNERA